MTQEDVTTTLAGLPALDVSPRRSAHLRRRCHAMLQPEPRPAGSARTADVGWLGRVVVPAFAGTWCLAYLVEIVRRAAAIYGYGTQ